MIFFSFLSANDFIYLIDLGVKIDGKHTVDKSHPSSNELNSKKYAALTNRHVSPTIEKIQLKNDLQKTKTTPTNILKLDNIELYNLGNKYFISSRYVEAIKLLEMVDFSELSNNQKKHLINLHTDALFSLGYYERIVNVLTENNTYDLNDELFFLLGMSSAEIGNKKIALHAFNEIIENFPNSQYKNISKLQVRVLKR